ncbi:glycosyltransferase [Erythrobacter sp. YT30]|uniref:glycosyltransferase n=1 Tax=Erythrobacter sp. YT30 TaxID=1735012 RepID=UPI000A6894F7|nr:glycosyltransferase [Erythrobacter sp. YT30]
MHILFLTSTLPRWNGDAQANFVGEQADAWIKARPCVRVTILAPHSAGAALSEHHGRKTIRRYRYLRPEKLQSVAYPAILPNLTARPWLVLQIPGLLAAQLHEARRIVRDEGVDLVYAHWVMPQGLVALSLKRTEKVPFILQTHSSDLGVFGKFGWLGKRVARSIIAEASHFFCVNSSQLDIARQFLPEVGRKNACTGASVLPMGVTKVVPVNAGAPRFDIGTIGRLSKKKGLDLLVCAARQAAEKGVRSKIGIAGDGEEKDTLTALAKNADIHFPGFLSGATKEEFLASCARFAFPAKARGGDVEGLPVALLEALMRGQPVLATRDTNIEMLPEWDAIKKDVVFLEDPEDIPAFSSALERLMEREPGSAENAKRVLARYLWDNLIEEYLTPIEATLA